MWTLKTFYGVFSLFYLNEVPLVRCFFSPDGKFGSVPFPSVNVTKNLVELGLVNLRT